MSILDLLRPNEVRATLLALDMEIDAAEGLFLRLGFSLAAPEVRDAIRKQPQQVISKLHDQHLSPKTLAYIMLVNQCVFLLETGKYHSGFGGLLMPGDGLATLWHRGADELENAGVWNAETAKTNRAIFRRLCE